ncbi:MAG: hypothetical protein U1E69_20350 [Tabrizicola sp.]|uniref:hypothetical protein n=1 Tax=Tabrizicola sp. TaxID=2005166 RepID=UPI002AB84E15|nr:hypothetical protein [Tabrizicola sp.]MDZ4089149.1 hypothetical protein [Tabrizicola sp.]
MSGAQVALRLLAPPASVDAPARKAGADAPAGPGDVSVLMTYAKQARALAKPAALAPPVDPAMPIVPEGYSVGDLVSVDTLEPEYRDFAASFGATHVRLVKADPISDEEFTSRITPHIDEIYADDPAYQAAKAAGEVTIHRFSDIMAELGETREMWQGMAFYRGPGGSELFGGGGTGIYSPSLERWMAARDASGDVVTVGGVGGAGYIASWKKQAR